MSGHGSVDLSGLKSPKLRLEGLDDAFGVGLSNFPTRVPDDWFSKDDNVLRLPFGQSGAGVPDLTGFRHFMGPLPPDKMFKIGDLDPHGDQKTTDELRGLMSRLAERMERDLPWDPHGKEDAERFDPAPTARENPRLPSGYTYLLQLIAHDLVQTSFAASVLEDTKIGIRNARSALLRLDTIYGDGPAVCPFAYALDDAPDEYRDGSRTLLRLGCMMNVDENTQLKTMSDNYRDIARTCAVNVTGIDTAGKLTEPLIVDARNDDHAILAQMTALFHLLHNGILQKLLPAKKKMVTADSLGEAAMDRFLCARNAVALIYRNIIRKDLMPRILHPGVYTAYAQSPKFLDLADEDPLEVLFATSKPKRPDFRIPLEFSHAAFRFAHAMVRDKYRINRRAAAEFDIAKALRQTSAKNPGAMPLDSNWIAQWSYFFDLRGDKFKPNLSMRIGPKFSALLVGLDELDDQRSKRLSYRDLLSGSFVALWSVDKLIDRIIARGGADLIKLSPFKDRDARTKMIKDWLGPPDPARLTADDIAKLSNDPPLFLFILCEAALDPNVRGLSLGVLGSIIVAETIFKILELDPLPVGNDSKSLKEALEKMSQRIYGKDKENYLADIPEIASMAELIKYTAKLCGLESDQSAFL